MTEREQAGGTRVDGGVGVAEPETPPTSALRGSTGVRLGIAAAALLAVAVLVVVTVAGGSPGPTGQPGAVAVSSSGAVAPPGAIPAQQAAPLAASAPARVRVPSISAESTLVPVGVDARNRMQVPPLARPMQAAWYSRSPTPGAVGPSVLVGHVNGDGRRGIFADLDRVRPGEEVDVARADGSTAVFTVYRVDTVPKDAFPTQQVYGDVPDAQLRLITCGGELDRTAHNYLSNVVVYATLTSTRSA